MMLDYANEPDRQRDEDHWANAPSHIIDEVCPRCDGPMVSNPDYKEPYCGSWEYMEGGCPPAPVTSVTRNP